MGAQVFTHEAEGKTAKEAFDKAVYDACYDYGHSGYTGTIAEKEDFVEIEIPKSWKGSVEKYIDKLIKDGDDRIDDKWGPAGCIKTGKNSYIFFGWAST
jgi:hypothetical protein